MADVIARTHFPDDGGPLAKSISLFFDILENQDMIKVENPKRIIDDELANKIYDEMEIEIETLSKLFPEKVKFDIHEQSPANISIDNYIYCPTLLWSIYASLILSKKWNAQSLFSEDAMNFLKYKFGSSLVTHKAISVPKSFDTIFTSYLPDYNIFPTYSFSSDPQSICHSCKYENRCDSSYLADLENNLYKYLDIRDYDEIEQLKTVLSKIKAKLESKKEIISHQDIINEFKEEERLIRKRIHSTFPKIKRWTNVSFMASTLIAIVSNQTGLPTISKLGVAIAGLSAITGRYINHLEDKYKWVGFKINDI